ncbi:anti-sigma factor family protein [Rhodoflexus caldus]|uniref:anti-sigma factor family protein n=1 Tax=Rhodoflexus caldus TaxID=2891236 RepID=UPI002029D566|nr:hypothetical protein [Rhodoflexus caldus]
MELNDNDTLLVERYLANELSESERKNFQARLQTDAELAAYVAAHRAVDAALTREHRKKRFAAYDKEIKRQNVLTVTIRYAAAAAVVLAAGIAAYWQWNKQEQPQLAQTKKPAQELLQIPQQTIQSRENTGMGFAGVDSAQQLIPLWLTAAPADAPAATYLFRDTLQVFVPIADDTQLKDSAFQQSLGLFLTYDRTQNDTYFLTFRGKKYALKRYTPKPEALE